MTTALRFMFRCIVEDIERIVGGDSASGPAGAAMGYARFAHGLAEVAFNPAVGPMLAFESLLVLAIMRLQKKKFVQEQRTYIIRFPARGGGLVTPCVKMLSCSHSFCRLLAYSVLILALLSL
jgi:hypothetical protein